MLKVITYCWNDPAYRHKYRYGSEDVRRLKTMIERNLTVPHEFIVFTDQSEFYSDIKAIPLNMEKHVPGRCFDRLYTFHPDGQRLIGEKVIQFDLDTIIVANFDHVVDREENIVLWRNPIRIPWDNPPNPSQTLYNTSLVFHTCGTLPSLWNDFDPQNPRCRDDQWWISSRVGPDAPYWDEDDGIYRLARTDTPGSGISGELPDNACIITFPGAKGKPWEVDVVAANPWIKDYYQAA